MWIQRQVDAPADDLLSFGQVAELFGLSSFALARIIESGEFPEGVRVGPEGAVWDWRAVAYYRLRMEMRPRLRPAADKHGPEE